MYGVYSSRKTFMLVLNSSEHQHGGRVGEEAAGGAESKLVLIMLPGRLPSRNQQRSLTGEGRAKP